MFFDPYAYDLATSTKAPQAGAHASASAALATEALLDVPQEARAVLWHGLTQAVSSTLDLWDSTPPGGRREPPPPTIQHAGRPQFHPAALRSQTLANWHRLVGIELRLAAEALEGLIQSDEPIYWARLIEQCGRIGQLYSELKRRAGEWVAEALLRWELRLLRYRASPVLAPLIYH